MGLARDARAQAKSGFALNRYAPAERGSDWLAGESLDLRGHGRLALGVTGDYAYRPLVIYNADDTVRASVVRDNLVLHLGGSLVLWERLRLGLSLPFQAYVFGEPGRDGSGAYAGPASDQALGDVRLTGDVRVLGRTGDAFTLAGGAQLWAPTGAKDNYMGDGEVRLSPRVMAAGDIAPFVYAARLGLMVRGRSESFGKSELGTEVVWSASAGLRLPGGRLVVGPEVYGSTVAGAFLDRLATPVEAVLGASAMVTPDWRVGGGAGAGLTPGFGAPTARVLLRVEWSPAVAVKRAPEDRDRDGIVDEKDACPDRPGIATSDPSTNGCSDRDHDGIVDVTDACPDARGVASADPTKRGCPLPGDRDHDGVLDTEDACPDDPGKATSDPKTTGCPDADGDGVVDRNDACVDRPGKPDPDPQKSGCPEPPPDPDRDKDGVPNEQDACPDAPGKPDPDPKKNGCPTAFVRGSQIVILDQVRFASGSAAIVPGTESQDVLRAVLKVLQEHPEIKRLRVEGHTDDQGGAAYNRTLSGQRAAAVVAWLVRNGVDEPRLTSQGFGPDRPVASNKDEAGRKQNRRVEFHIQEPGQ